MILPDAPWRHREGLVTLLDALGQADGTIRFVGGAVRDTLLGLSVTDIDCATQMKPAEVERRIGGAGFKAIPTGLAHGTITAVLPSGPVEITTLRDDVATNGRHATVAFSDDWKADAARRDFTINALSADPLTSAIFDYFDGLADLDAGIVRFIGDPLTRIAEDHLRIMRFFRFHARFGHGQPDPASLDACATRANDLMALSRERIADELLKLLGWHDPVATIRLMIDHGIFRPIIPNIVAESAARLEALLAREALCAAHPDPIRRLAAILPQDSAQAGRIAAQLKMSKTHRRRIEIATSACDPLTPLPVLLYHHGAESMMDLLLLSDTSGERLNAAKIRAADWKRPRLPVGGGDLIAMGLTPGPTVAATLQAVERQWVEEDFADAARVVEIAHQQVDQTLRALRKA